MPFREKVKRAFGRPDGADSSDQSESPSKASTRKPKKEKDYPENVYRPGEVPPSKYKGPYNREHQQKLHAFSFSNAFQGRRKSEQKWYDGISDSSKRLRKLIFVVGISRQQTREGKPRPQRLNSNEVDRLRPIETLHGSIENSFGQPFSADELTLAMTKSTLKSPAA
ncbi:MAG: hypothetical protein Q9214_001352 [Letrouitia sp. 1 TL-2023]